MCALRHHPAKTMEKVATVLNFKMFYRKIGDKNIEHFVEKAV